MKIVYILLSQSDQNRFYIGVTDDLERRLTEHNNAIDGCSKRYAPWVIETYITFRDPSKAFEFEKYLKQGSGHAFLKKRLLGKNYSPSQ